MMAAERYSRLVEQGDNNQAPGSCIVSREGGCCARSKVISVIVSRCRAVEVWSVETSEG